MATTTTALVFNGIVIEGATRIPDTDGTEGGGSSVNLSIIEMSYDEYLALSDDERNDGQMRFITDKNCIILNNNDYGDKIYSIWKPNKKYFVENVVLYKDPNDGSYTEYICKTEHISESTFDITKWEELKFVEFEDYTEEEILEMLGMNNVNLEELQSIIKDDQISLNSTFSSSKIYAEIANVISEAKKYTLNKFGSLISPKFKVVDSISSVVDQSFIYIVSNGTTSTFYVLEEDGSITPFSAPIEIDLGSISTEQMATKVDKDNVLKTFTQPSSVDQIYNANVIYDKLNSITKSRSVSDSQATEFTLTIPSDFVTNNGESPSYRAKYCIKNGWVHVNIILKVQSATKSTQANIISTDLPKSLNEIYLIEYPSNAIMCPAVLSMDENSNELQLVCNSDMTEDGTWSFNFSYPMVEE